MSTQLRQARAALQGKPTTGPDASLWARIGYWAGLAVLQVLLVEFVVAASWRGLYSYRTNFVSELGVAFCGPTGNWPCSSLYPLMNVSIALFGLSLVVAATAWMVTGVVDVRGGILLCVAGFGGIVAGVVNQGLNYGVHSFGATVFFVVGSLGLIVAGGHRSLRRTIGITVTTLGGIALTATLLYIGGHSVGIGIGAVERIVVYSILAGTVILAVAHRSTARRMKIVSSAAISNPFGKR
ncbi:hypothetical protein [Rhodococcus sp. BP22]|uniref:hypothetical protein n=1 Tax=Rhodococcus sp. BP22 TaxID=2758566 RepID=UPI00164696C6|nr:hypothetical protein [Rhodococcus sp. BP22]